MLELSLTRLFSATMYYHFAFMAISLALFGSGASGVFVYVFQDRLNKIETGKLLSIFALLFGLSVVVALVVILQNPLTFNSIKDNFFRLAKIYTVTVMPFFFGGCVVTVAITRLASDISRLYRFDLAGAAFGCLLLIPALNYFGAINTVILIGAVASASAILFSLESRRRSLTIACVAITAAILGFSVYNYRAGVLEIRSAKGKEESNILFSKWNSFSRITVVQIPQGPIDVRIDADASTPILAQSTNTALHQDLRSEISTLAYNLKPNAHVAIIGPGGGRDVTAALVFDAKKIAAIEINPIIARDIMLSEPFSSYSGDIYRHPNVDLIVDEGRSFVRRSTDRYDVLQATMVDTWAATAAGAFSLSENNLYTVEAFREYAEHLTDDGILTMTRWYFEPPTEMLRLVSISRVMMDDLKIADPARHIILMRSRVDNYGASHCAYLFKKSPFTDDEVRRLEAVGAENNLEVLYTPLTRPENDFTKLLETKDPSGFMEAYPTNIFPTYDNNPFFFNSVRLSDIGMVASSNWVWRTTNLGTVVLVSLLGITAVLVVLFMILPLIFVRDRLATGETGSRLPYLFYFIFLGAGFIIIELAMIQRFILFLGHPVYALAVILFSLLLFSSIGSSISGRFPAGRSRKNLLKVIFALVGVTFLYILVLGPAFHALVWLPLAVRIVLAVVLMAPMGLLMGMPMPMGIKILAEEAPQIIPWAWGLNGAASVMGTSAALSIALFTGFNQALIVGAAIYLVGALCIAIAGRARKVESLA